MLRFGVVGRRAPLVAFICVAALFPLGELLRSFVMRIYFEGTDEALYAARVGGRLGAVAGIALVVLLLGAIVAAALARTSAGHAPLAAAVTVALGLAITAYGHVAAAHELHPFTPELRALDAFTPPAGATLSWTDARASDNPEVTRHWESNATLAAVCPQAEAEFRRWMQPATEERRPFPCFIEARRGGAFVRLTVVERLDRPGVVLLGVTVRRT